MDIPPTAEDVDFQARSLAFEARPCNFQRKEPSLIHRVFRASKLEELNLLCELCQVLSCVKTIWSMQEKSERQLPGNYCNSAKWFTQAGTCRKVPGTGRLPRSTFSCLSHNFPHLFIVLFSVIHPRLN